MLSGRKKLQFKLSKTYNLFFCLKKGKGLSIAAAISCPAQNTKYVSSDSNIILILVLNINGYKKNNKKHQRTARIDRHLGTVEAPIVQQISGIIVPLMIKE